MLQVKNNFRNAKNSWCRTCSLFKETQSHILDCFAIRRKLRNIVEFDKIRYDYISGNVAQQELIAKTYT